MTDRATSRLSAPRTADVVVIGAGAVGASVARHLARTGCRVTVLEKESGPAFHQSGRNSGVIHAGYNLKPGSQKAQFCAAGNRQLREYCHDHGVAVVEGGILVVARADADRGTLAELSRRAAANGVAAQLVDEAELRRLEPHAVGVEALHAPEGASFDAPGYVRALLAEAESHGAHITYGVLVERIADPGRARSQDVVVYTSAGDWTAGVVVSCAGLQADRLAGSLARGLRIVPFRGYYAELRPGRTDLVRSHIYAAPDLSFPFLGAHLSRRWDGRVLVGPGAMLAFGREAYALHHVGLRDLGEMVTWPGLYRLLGRPEVRRLIRGELVKSLSLKAIWSDVRHLVPDLQPGDLVRSFAGNRAQVVSSDGALIDDMLVIETEHAIHVLNAVSPGLTCSLPFGKHLAERGMALLAGRV